MSLRKLLFLHHLHVIAIEHELKAWSSHFKRNFKNRIAASMRHTGHKCLNIRIFIDNIF